MFHVRRLEPRAAEGPAGFCSGSCHPALALNTTVCSRLVWALSLHRLHAVRQALTGTPAAFHVLVDIFGRAPGAVLPGPTVGWALCTALHSTLTGPAW